MLGPVHLAGLAVEEREDAVDVDAVGRTGVQHGLQEERVVGGLAQLLALADVAGQHLHGLELAGDHRQGGAVTVAAVQVDHAGVRVLDGPVVLVEVAVQPHRGGELGPGAGVVGAPGGDVDTLVHGRDEVAVGVGLLEAGLDVRLLDGRLRGRQGHALGDARDGDDLQLQVVTTVGAAQGRRVVALGEDLRGADVLLAHERVDRVELAVDGGVLDAAIGLEGLDLDVLGGLLEGLAGGVEVVTEEVEVEGQCQHEGLAEAGGANDHWSAPGCPQAVVDAFGRSQIRWNASGRSCRGFCDERREYYRNTLGVSRNMLVDKFFPLVLGEKSVFLGKVV